jgi:hypothetical protein
MGSRAQLQHLGIQPMQLVTKPMGYAAKFLKQTCLSSAQLAQDEESRRPQAHCSEALRIGPQCVGQSQRLTPIIPSYSVAVSKAIKLFGMDRTHLEPLLESRLDNGATGHLNGNGDPAGRAA